MLPFIFYLFNKIFYITTNQNGLDQWVGTKDCKLDYADISHQAMSSML